LPMAVVSNTLCGAAHRDFLAAAGLAGLFVAQFYSDEAGVRKPNPELAHRAARAVGVPVGGCWFVGDSLHRDVVCARRAGVGATILMRSPRTDRDGPLPGVVPDAVVEDGHGLVALLERAKDG
ncbi:HAD family hydrolase, partial [Micromonospora phytophila]|uniref:HAD family hydrolase n=1 Tax=Micromonospora phytophila TaxID=709888 RepID=UPI00202EB05C